jgi:uncharacterized protein (DUF1330 family)
VSVLVIAQLRFTDLARYRTYQAAFPAVFATSGGRLLAADEAPQTLEGVWPFDKIVVMSFPNEALARAFLEGDAYRAISRDRAAGAETVAILVQGI